LQTSLRIMDRNTVRLLELTNQLLDFRQTEIHGFRLYFVKTNVSSMMEETYLSFAALAEQKGLHFSQHLPEIPLEAFVDVEAFSKILYNLYGNAVKYAENKVEIVLLPQSENDITFCMKIKNDGLLIPDHLREKIFEPFYRIKETDKQQGTGIGLALSRSLAQLHKGELVLNEPENGMNCFSLTLPIQQEVDRPLNVTLNGEYPVTEQNSSI
jgi:signal transduction histidine kinase